MNKWIKILVIFLAAFDSYSIAGYLLDTFLENLVLKTFLNYSFMIFTVILASLLILKISGKQIFRRLGLFKKRIFDSLLVSAIFLLGIVCFSLIVFLLKSSQLSPYYATFSKYLLEFSTSFSDFNISLIFFAGVIVQIYAAFIEEFIFRGLIINTLSENNKIESLVISVIASAVLFSLWHLGADNNLLIGKLVLGLLFGTCFVVSGRSSVSSGILHSISNLWFPANLLYLFYF